MGGLWFLLGCSITSLILKRNIVYITRGERNQWLSLEGINLKMFPSPYSGGFFGGFWKKYKEYWVRKQQTSYSGFFSYFPVFLFYFLPRRNDLLDIFSPRRLFTFWLSAFIFSSSSSPSSSSSSSYSSSSPSPWSWSSASCSAPTVTFLGIFIISNYSNIGLLIFRKWARSTTTEKQCFNFNHI